MKTSYQAAVVLVAGLTLGATAVAFADSTPTGKGTTPQGMWGMHGMMNGNMRDPTGMGPGHMHVGALGSLMTQEDQTAFREKMRNAKTPGERQQLAEAMRTDMQKRAAEKDIALPEHAGAGNMHR